jgi:hypothetical protein
MIEKACDLWLERADYRCIITSGAVDGGGEAILESPSAVAAAKKFAGVATDLGRLINSRGNHVHVIRPGLLSFPIKQFQWSGANLQIIQRSANELAQIVGAGKTLLPKPLQGAAPTWEQVKPLLASLPDTVIVIG